MYLLKASRFAEPLLWRRNAALHCRELISDYIQYVSEGGHQISNNGDVVRRSAAQVHYRLENTKNIFVRL